MNAVHNLDGHTLGLYLEEHVAGFRSLLSINKFNVGQPNPSYLPEAESGRYVLRAKPPGALLNLPTRSITDTGQ